MLVSKDVGDERWAITYDVQNHTVIGNVFFPSGGDALFIWCEELRTNGDPDPRTIERTFGCYGSNPCEGDPCSAEQWSFISEVSLPGEFFLPPATAAPTPVPTPVSATRTPTPVATADALASLLGTWTFQTTIISVFFDHYRLERVETVNGVRVITGTDLDDGSTILLARPADLIDDPFPYDYALLDPGTSICDFFVFDRTGNDTVAGADILTDVSAGRCSGLLTGNPHPMTGIRTAHASAATGGDDALQPDTLIARREQLVRHEDIGKAETADASPRSAAVLLQRLDALASDTR